MPMKHSGGEVFDRKAAMVQVGEAGQPDYAADDAGGQSHTLRCAHGPTESGPQATSMHAHDIIARVVCTP
jgi:hypothetical protein